MSAHVRATYSIVVLFLSTMACSLAGLTGDGTSSPEQETMPSPMAPPVQPAAQEFQGAMPVDLPATRADRAGDIDTSPNARRALVSGGDVFVDGLYERPFNRDPMDKYFAYIDIIDAQGFIDDTWGYATITLVDRDPNDSLSAHYGVELDTDRDGRGDWLIRASGPTSDQWVTQGVQAWSDPDSDVGGVAILAADSKPRGGSGYEELIFDEGNGNLTDGAWARIKPGDPRTVELAFKLEMIGSPSSYTMGAWAATNLDSAMFDYHDHMTHIQAGSPNPGYEVYPLQDMAEIDNTCRLAIGFAPTGKEPGLCQTVEKREGETTTCVPGSTILNTCP